jgi:glucokinase
MISAVDIGGTKIAVGEVSSNGKVVARLEVETEPEKGFAYAMERIRNMLRANARSTGTRISGIGMACTGPVDPFSGEIGEVDFLQGWQGHNPVQALSHEFGVPAAMENDADAGALAEAAWGAGSGKRNLLYVTVGTGIGSGLILDGRLYRGVGRSHPELGHHVIDATGPACGCGARGCWESLACGPAMVGWLKAEAPKDYPHLTNLTAKRICELAQQGDLWARRATEREAHYLGIGLANLVTLFTPEIIILGGGVMNSAHLFWDGIRKVIQSSCRLVPAEKTELTTATFGADSALIGAARVWHDRFGRAESGT